MKNSKRYKYRLQKKEQYIFPNVLGNHNYPVYSYRWSDIAVSDDKNSLSEYMNALKKNNPKSEYRIEDCL